MTFKEAVEMERKGRAIMRENPYEGLRLIKEADSACELKFFESICLECIHVDECPWKPDIQEDDPVESCNLYESNHSES